jgi:PAS domain S-box-containing protein
MPGGSIKLKVFLVVLLVAGGFVAISGVWFHNRARQELLTDAAVQAWGVLSHASQEMVLEGRWLPAQQLQRISDYHTHLRPRLRAMLAFDQAGRPLFPQNIDANILAKLSDYLKISEPAMTELGPGMLFAAVQPVLRQGRKVGALVGLVWLEDLDRQLEVMRQSFWWLGLGSWALLIAVLYGALHWLVVRPLERLERASTALAQGRLQARAEVGGDDELGRLGTAFNQMADSLTRSLAATDQERQKLRVIMDTQSDCLFAVDPQGRLMLANRRFSELMGISEKDMIGRNCSEILQSDMCSPGCPLFGPNQGGQALESMEARLRLPGGKTIPIRKYAKVVRDNAGKILGGVETFRDISHEKELARLRAEWESFIRHELKNPLNPILALSGELLRREPEPEERRRYLELIHDGARNMSRLLDLTREVQMYEAGRLRLNLVEHDLAATIASAAEQASRAVEARPELWAGPEPPAWRLEAPPELNTIISHDPEKMARVFANLMQNAWEHHPGLVTVRLAEPAPGWLQAVVHNQGEPIPPERLATIFEKFNTTKQKQGGSGLGTTIARLFMEGHGGTISAASSAQDGTEFSLRLPRRRVEV